MRITTWARGIVITVLFAFALGMWGWLPNQINAQTVELPQFKYDPFWPKPLPDGWVLGSVGRCVEGNYALPGWLRGHRLEELAFKEGRGPDPATKDGSETLTQAEVPQDPLQ
jgi:hypothetical protein